MTGTENTEIVRVKNDSEPKSVAAAIAHAWRRGSSIEITAIGSQAVYRAVRALAFARGYTVEEGADLIATPFVRTLDEPVEDDRRKVAIHLRVEDRNRH